MGQSERVSDRACVKFDLKHSETTHFILTKLHRNDPGMNGPLQKEVDSCQNSCCDGNKKEKNIDFFSKSASPKQFD